MLKNAKYPLVASFMKKKLMKDPGEILYYFHEKLYRKLMIEKLCFIEANISKISVEWKLY